MFAAIKVESGLYRSFSDTHEPELSPAKAFKLGGEVYLTDQYGRVALGRVTQQSGNAFAVECNRGEWREDSLWFVRLVDGQVVVIDLSPGLGGGERMEMEESLLDPQHPWVYVS